MSLSTKQGKGIAILESLTSLVFDPFQNLFAQSIKSVSDRINHYLDLVDTSKENTKLRLQVERLISEKNELIERVSKQNRVSALMAYEKDQQKNFLVASVIGRDATQWSKVVFVNKGTRDGVEDHLAVVTNLGVIGQVIHAGLTTSKVLLIIDSRSAIDAVFQESRVSAVVVGTGKKECQVKYVPNTKIVKSGDQVLSSGLGGIFPKGLVIGTVSNVIRKKQGLFQEIMLTPRSDFSKLEEVLIFLSEK